MRDNLDKIWNNISILIVEIASFLAGII